MNIYCEFENLSENDKKNKNLVKKIEFKEFKTTLTTVNITSKKQEKLLKKEIGTYTTIFCEEFNYLTNINFDFLTKILTKEIKKIIDLESKNKKNIKYFVVGLGNPEITADCLGVNVVKKIICTTKDLENNNLSNKDFGNVFSLTPSISSKNGIYTLDIIKSICSFFKPDLVFIIDSLSCKNAKYLGKTFQVNTCGLTPGCEIKNKQPKIDKEGLKIPVISIGCPVVINLSNIQNKPQLDPVLTLKDIDVAIKTLADIISFSLNKIIHKNLSKDEIIFLSK